MLVNSNLSAFEHLCVYMNRSADFIPLAFILGFYVTQVVNRWWGQYNSIVWPDTLALNLVSFMPGREVTQHSIQTFTLIMSGLGREDKKNDSQAGKPVQYFVSETSLQSSGPQVPNLRPFH